MRHLGDDAQSAQIMQKKIIIVATKQSVIFVKLFFALIATKSNPRINTLLVNFTNATSILEQFSIITFQIVAISS